MIVTLRNSCFAKGHQRWVIVSRGVSQSAKYEGGIAVDAQGGDQFGIRLVAVARRQVELLDQVGGGGDRFVGTGETRRPILGHEG